MAGTKTITSGKNGTKVGANGTEIYTATRVTYTFDDNGQIDPTKTKKEILYYKTPLTIQPEVGAVQTGTSKGWEFPKLAGFGQPVLGADAQKSLKEGALKNTTEQQIQSAAKKEGLTPEQTKSISTQSNVATNPGNPDAQASLTAFQKEYDKGFKQNTRENYEDVKYPLNLKLENQDCIKFSILKYIPPGVQPGVSNAKSRIVKLQEGSKPGINGKPIATITLPIPAGIGDRNSANWQEDPLNDITRAFTNISMQTILNGGTGLTGSVGQEASNVAPGGDTGFLQQITAATAAEAATGSSNILSRQFGAIVNPNLELLFTGPSLRNFTFNFRFTPREPAEAIAVRKIIRQFKQAMSVKRSASSLLLRAPHTFAISYLSNNKDHPYLNRFKECALTDCAVNYTPDGTYMTYTDSSMTAYELSLTFQELEPIFDDEYYEIDKNQDTSIGF